MDSEQFNLLVNLESIKVEKKYLKFNPQFSLITNLARMLKEDDGD